MLKRRTVPVISAVLIAAYAGAGSLASADSQSELASAVLSAHGTSGCPPLQSDPLVTRVGAAGHGLLTFTFRPSSRQRRWIFFLLTSRRSSKRNAAYATSRRLRPWPIRTPRCVLGCVPTPRRTRAMGSGGGGGKSNCVARQTFRAQRC